MMMLSQTSLTGGALLGLGVELVPGRHRVMVPCRFMVPGREQWVSYVTARDRAIRDL
jgi:hypothetical protein